MLKIADCYYFLLSIFKIYVCPPAPPHELKERLVDTLTFQQCNVLALVAQGNSNKEIAILLDISVKTVETHRKLALKRCKAIVGNCSNGKIVRFFTK